MVHRITISIDEKLESTIREIQAQKIASTKKSVSFSYVVNQILREAVKEQIRMVN